MSANNNLTVISIGLAVLLSVILIPAIQATVSGDANQPDMSVISDKIAKINEQIATARELPQKNTDAINAKIEQINTYIENGAKGEYPSDHQTNNNQTNNQTNQTGNQTNQTNSTLCVPYNVTGCKICSSLGTVWIDENARCLANQTCQNGTCIANPTNQTNQTGNQTNQTGNQTNQTGNQTNQTNTTLCAPNSTNGCKVCSTNGMNWSDDSTKCAVNQTCQSGVCVATQICTPSTVSGCKECSLNGLSWFNNNSRCNGGQTCNAGICVATPICTPNSTNGCKVCSLDGLSWSDDNSKCLGGQTCNAGICVATPICTPNSTNGCKVCSLDGLSWSDDSTKCEVNQTCQSGACIDNTTNTTTQICTPGTVDVCKVCSLDGMSWSDDNTECAGGQICQSGTCVATQICTPNSTNGCKVCSLDGMSWFDNNSKCLGGQTCQSGTCVATQICTPNSTNGCLVCSLDGMSWSDDSTKCLKGQRCEAGACITNKYILIRDDDAQGYWMVIPFKNVTTTLIQNEIPQTIGLVPYMAGGATDFSQDANLMTYLNSVKNEPTVEIALHGYLHDESEFTTINQTNAQTKISAGKTAIYFGLGVMPTTFIPPYNEFSSGTIAACSSEGFTRISADTTDPNSWKESPQGLLHLPETVEFYNADTNQTRSATEIINDCAASLSSNNICVILMHPQELAASDAGTQVDQTQYQTLLDLINWIKQQKSQGVKLTTMGDFNPNEFAN